MAKRILTKPADRFRAGELTGITGCHLPRTRIHHYAGRTFISCELGAKGCGDFSVPLFGQFAGFTVHLTGRSDCKLKPDGVVQILAYEYLSIDLIELDVRIPGDFKLFCYECQPSRTVRDRMSAHAPRVAANSAARHP